DRVSKNRWLSYADQAGLKLTGSTCLCLLSAKIKGLHHHARLLTFFFNYVTQNRNLSRNF
ncbi:mCG145218, partial [Mus musculus]